MGLQEDKMLVSRLQDTVAACRPHRPSFYGFLDEREVSLLAGVPLPMTRLSVLWGGREDADRVMLGVFDGSDYCSDPDEELQQRKRRSAFPIVRLRATAVGAGKFQSAPQHRDYLGALMGLGLQRKTVGDIVCDDEGAFIWCDESVADFIMRELTSAGRCSLRCERAAQTPENVDLSEEKCYNHKDTAEMAEIGVTSPRLDALLAGLARISRQKAEQLLLSGAVRYNYQECTEKDHPVCEGDVFSVSKLGKYRVVGLQTRGKKGRTYVLLSKYR